MQLLSGVVLLSLPYGTDAMNSSLSWHILTGERSELYPPFGLRPVDDYTGNAPMGWIRAKLDVNDGGGGWRETDIKPVFTASCTFAYPGLERSAAPVGAPPRRYRVRVDTQFYLPLYRTNSTGIEFDVYPYNDTNPPQQYVQLPADLFLVPATNYSFPGHVAVLRGEVRDANGDVVADALVTEQNRERVLTDTRGSFALPLRWVANPGRATIDVSHAPTGRTGVINVQLPQDLGKNQTITIS